MIFFIGTGVSFLVGILFVVLGICFIIKDKNLKQNGVEIWGYINNLVSSSHSTGTDSIDYAFDSKYVYVTYVYNGQQYLKNVLYYKKDMKVGDRITLLCDPNNPEQVVVKGTSVAPYVFLCLGIAGILMGSFMTYLSILSIL